MSTPNVIDIIRVPGRFAVDITDPSLDFPHGGTAIGIQGDPALETRAIESPIEAEEFGGVRVDYIYAGEVVVFAFELRTYDEDAIAQVFPNTDATGIGRIQPRIDYNVTDNAGFRAGSLMGSRNVNIVFSPEAIDHHPMFVLWRAIPLRSQTAKFNLGRHRELGMGVFFEGTPRDNGLVYSVGSRADFDSSEFT